ncbi:MULTISPECIES: SDR family oxidoreductase [Pandoraea]|uniref:Short-chain dehydrogenase n=2 Tax=Pandoraea TaxID=93217 RepID=A0AAW7MH53_9BURK|nr:MULTISPECIES: SDR family oxidoreductase [Pandoraea]ALS65171.1 short-chain dehydrogenase [Pandoraea apista]MDN4572072.1 short-chain dehydrogenase [Pandoraea cepalis]MDN4576728.1 short-chain dehydrogenase [Pandoraea cepalis]QHE94794.1 SDR family oxidoreductase [Pandoraea fibrosis]QHF15932.1 SDR family oxidoreductase [Pandoraea fibrosis]
MLIDSMFDLAGKVALVNGGSRGIGEAIARTLSAYGAHVVIASRKADACEQVAHSIRESGGQASARPCHLGDLTQIEATFAEIEATHGGLDILVNNAAANPYQGPIVDTSPAVFAKTVDVNVRGFFYSSVCAARQMARRGGGSILNVASVNAFAPGDQQGIYSITKAAVISMTLAFARECAADNIRVNALVPGPTDTRFAAPLIHDPASMASLMPRLPLGRVGQPSDMVGAALYLVSDAASFTTGASLTVDGGFLLS